jgi:Putative sensor
MIMFNEASKAPKPPVNKVKWPVFNPKTYATILYFILSLPFSIITFTLMVTGIAVSVALMPLFIGFPLFFIMAKFIDGMVKFEQGLIRQIVGHSNPTEPIGSPEKSTDTGSNWFMRMVHSFDGPLLVRNIMIILLKLVSSILFFTLTITLIATSLGLITFPIVHIILLNEIQVDILAQSYLTYFIPDHWSNLEEYLIYVSAGVILFWLSMRIINGLMGIQRRIMLVDEPYIGRQPKEPQIPQQPLQPVQAIQPEQPMQPIYTNYTS